MILLLRCPQCGNRQKYQPTGSVGEKKKRCVYCGHSFTVRRCIIPPSD